MHLKSPAAKPLKPFPQHCSYAGDSILPNGYTQYQLDSITERFYISWKAKYIKTAKPGQRYVSNFDVKDFEDKDISPECTSEGQGYGMLVVSLMAGFDPEAHQLYNDMFRYYEAHISNFNSDGMLMAWAQNANHIDIEDDAATDGDMDIAYSLLIANAQWGNSDTDYLGHARKMINAIAKYEINNEISSIKIGNAIEKESKEFYETRTSDFMPAHFHAFFKATGDSVWQKVIATNYRWLLNIQSEYSSGVGLVPGYIVKLNTNNYHPHAGEKGTYEFNACRVPWRVALDYILNGNEESHQFCSTLNNWLISQSNKPLYHICEGYKLNGKPFDTQDELEKFEGIKFLAPFTVSAMTSGNQQWLNDLFKMMIHFDIDHYPHLDYYDNTIKMICLIILSGNYWKP